MSENILDAFGGNSYPAIKWADIGQGNVVTGTIIDIPSKPVQDKLNPDKSSVPIGLEVGGEKRTLWVGTDSNLGGAIKAACVEAKATTLQIGAMIHVKWDSNEPPKQPGHSPMRVFKVKYEAPASGVAVDDVF
jgi:hypothetical protein